MDVNSLEVIWTRYSEINENIKDLASAEKADEDGLKLLKAAHNDYGKGVFSQHCCHGRHSTLLHRATITKMDKCVKYILSEVDSKLLVEPGKMNGKTPVHCAVNPDNEIGSKAVHQKMVNTLNVIVEAAGDNKMLLHATDNNNETPLQLAHHHKNQTAIDLLE